MRRAIWLASWAACAAPEPPARPTPAPAPAPVHGDIQRVSIEASRHTLGGQRSHHYELARAGADFAAEGHAIPASHVAALAAALGHLHASDGLQTCIDHTDDYPFVVVTIERTGGRVELRSTSNCHDLVPWNVIVDGHLYAQYDGSAGRAIHQLLVDLDPKVRELGPPDRVPSIELAHVQPAPENVATAPPLRERVAALITSDPRAGAREITGMSITCSAADDCRELSATLWTKDHATIHAVVDGDHVVSVDVVSGR